MKIEVTTHGDEKRVFLDTKTNTLVDEQGQYVKPLGARARRRSKQQPRPTFWQNVRAFLQRNW